MTEIEEMGGGPAKYPITELSNSIWWRETYAEFGLVKSREAREKELGPQLRFYARMKSIRPHIAA